MKVSDAFKLKAWVSQNRQYILAERPNMATLREKSELALGFKCPQGAIAACLDEEQLPRRISKEAAKIQGLTEERDTYRSALLKLMVLTTLEPSLAEELREILAFDEELASLLKKKAS